MEGLITRYGLAPIHVAAFGGNIDEVKRLVTIDKADVNAKDKEDSTPLHWALKGSPVIPDILLVLVKLGADVNAKDKSGNTPLHLASTIGLAAATQRLLALGADPALKNNNKKTPADTATGKAYDLFVRRENDAERTKNAKGLAMVSVAEKLPYDLTREIGKNLGLKFDRLTPQSAKKVAGKRKTRARKTKRRITRRRR